MIDMFSVVAIQFKDQVNLVSFFFTGDKKFYKPQMEALQFDSQKKKLSLIKTDLPTVVDKTDVIVKVVYAGICGTDLHIMDVSLFLQYGVLLTLDL